MKHSLSSRIWACLAHVPIITIIWTGYIIIHNYRCSSWDAFASNPLSSMMGSLPITPILLTLCSIPISLSVMFLKKKSQFICNNARAAYVFNTWLIKGYILMFIGALMGILTHISTIIMGVAMLAAALSALSIIQSVIGVVVALRGGIYPYWYPWRLS